jgi:hypothetical protein
MTQTFTDRALAAVRRNFSVVPCQPRGKRPLRGAKSRVNTEDGVRALAAQVPIDANYGLCSDENFTVLETDDRARFTALLGKPLPPTLCVSARSNRVYWVFEQTPKTRTVTDCPTRPGLFEWRHTNQYCVGFGSIHPDTGEPYRIVTDVPPAPFPEWLAEKLLALAKESPSSKPGVTGAPDQNALETLKSAFLKNLDPQDLFGLEKFQIDSLHPTLMEFSGFLHDGERTATDIADILEKLCAEYGHRDPRGRRELDEIADWVVKKEPCELCLPDGHPLIVENSKLSIGMTAFENAEAQAKWVAENIDVLDIKLKIPEVPRNDSTWFFPAHHLVNALLPPQRIFVYTVEGTPVLRASFLVELFAFRGLGKSAIAMGITKLLLKGGEFLDYRSEGGARVLYVDGELPLCLLQERIKTFIGDTTENLWFMSAEQLPGQVFPALIDPAVQAMFEERLELLKPDVIILDTLTACGKFDTNDGDAWRIFNSFLLRLRFKGYCVIVVHHAGKNGTQRGRTDAEDNMDLVMHLTPPEGHDPGDGLKACVSYTKVRYGGRLQNFTCEYVGGSWRLVVDSDEKEIVDLLNGGTSIRNISTSLGVTIARVRAVRKKAKAKGLLSIPAKKQKAVKTAEELEQEKSIREVL